MINIGHKVSLKPFQVLMIFLVFRNTFTRKYSTHFKSEKNWSICWLMPHRKSFCRNQYEIKCPKLIPDTKHSTRDKKLVCHSSVSILIKYSTAITNVKKKVTILIIFYNKCLNSWLMILKQRSFWQQWQKILMQFICQGNSMLEKLYLLTWRQLRCGKKSKRLSL